MSGPDRVRVAKPLTALVVDDEPLARDAVRRVLREVPDVEVVCECENGAEAIQRILDLQPDLVLLDVQMPGKGGFDVCREVGASRMPTVVFVTAHDRYAIDAFRVHAVDYVLKPFDDQRLSEAVRRAARRTRLELGEALSQRLSQLLGAVADATETSAVPAVRRLTVRSEHGVRYVRVDDIDWLEADRNHVHIHAGDERHTIRATLASVLERLPSQFVRVHRSRVVNLDRVEEVQPWFSGDYVAILQGGRRLRVSRRYKGDLLRPGG